MIFALFIILIFAGMVAFVQFGIPDNTTQPRAALYAQNMALWHQAAILQAQDDMASGATLPCSGTPCAPVDLNLRIWNAATGTVINKFQQYWPEYQPMVPITQNFSGWQSYLIRQINATTGTANANDGEAYVLTIFRGFSHAQGGGAAPNYVGSEKGGVDESNFVRSLASNVAERSGIGTLSCNAGFTQCEFFRRAAQTVPDGTAASVSDAPLIVPMSIFTAAQRPFFAGRPAMLTRINTN